MTRRYLPTLRIVTALLLLCFTILLIAHFLLSPLLNSWHDPTLPNTCYVELNATKPYPELLFVLRSSSGEVAPIEEWSFDGQDYRQGTWNLADRIGKGPESVLLSIDPGEKVTLLAWFRGAGWYSCNQGIDSRGSLFWSPRLPRVSIAIPSFSMMYPATLDLLMSAGRLRKPPVNWDDQQLQRSELEGFLTQHVLLDLEYRTTALIALLRSRSSGSQQAAWELIQNSRYLKTRRSKLGMDVSAIVDKLLDTEISLLSATQPGAADEDVNAALLAMSAVSKQLALLRERGR